MLTQEINLECTYDVDEFFELLGDEAEDYELIGGKIVPREKPGPGAEHGEIINKLGFHLELYANRNGSKHGRIFSASACLLGRPQGSNWVIPDISYVLSDRLPAKFSGPLPVAPDLVVEVNSPSDNLERMRNKIDEYLREGVRMVWSIYPLDKYVLVYQPDQTKQTYYDMDAELDGGSVLPGFKLPIKVLFD